MKVHQINCGHIHPFSVAHPQAKQLLTLLEFAVNSKLPSGWQDKLKMVGMFASSLVHEQLKRFNLTIDGVDWDLEAQVLQDLKTVPCRCMLVETKDRLVLIDTGLGSDLKRTAPYAIQKFSMGPEIDGMSAPEQISALGLNPEDVSDVIISHLDFDHVAGLNDFPKAKVHLQQSEWDMISQLDTVLSKARFNQKLWDHQVQWTFYQGQGQTWMGKNQVMPMQGTDDDILLIPMVGHTKGHQGVGLVSEKILFCADAYLHQSQLQTTGAKESLVLKAYNALSTMMPSEFNNNLEWIKNFQQKNPDRTILNSHSPT